MQTEIVSSSTTALKSAKRGEKERVGVHAWHAYYAGFSEDFVESAIAYLNCNSEKTILDPWGGSGTTSLVASRNGIRSFSIDINPAISALSASKSFDVLKYRKEIADFLEKFQFSSEENDAEGNSKVDVDLILRNIINSAYDSFPKPSIGYKKAASNFLRKGAENFSFTYPLSAFIQVAAFRLGRRSQINENLSNPTWTKHRKKINRYNYTKGSLELICREMLGELEAAYKDQKGAQSTHLVGDSRKLPIATSVIDAIITSPPYLTRIDYAVSAAPELSLMETTATLREIRLDTMGSPVIRGTQIPQNSLWGEKCNNFLNSVASHDSKAAKSYYLKHMLQYFDDMQHSLSEIRRVLRRGGKALVVVQGSYFKDIFCPLGDIYVEMAKGIGLKAEIVFNDRVAGHMAHLNKRSSKYQARKVYSEDVVELTKK